MWVFPADIGGHDKEYNLAVFWLLSIDCSMGLFGL